jgi:hypothetical protein
LLKQLYLKNSDAQAISISCYGLGQLAESQKFDNPIPGIIIEKLITKLVSTNELTSQVISNMFYGIGKLAKAKKVTGISKATLLDLFKKLEAKLEQDINAQAISNSFLGLADGVKNSYTGDSTDDQIKDDVIIEFIQSLLVLNPTVQDIVSVLYSIGDLAEANFIKRTQGISAVWLNKLIEKLLQQQDGFSELSIAIIGIGKMISVELLDEVPNIDALFPLIRDGEKSSANVIYGLVKILL